MLKEVQGVDKFETIVLVYGQDFPDGLSASYLAAVKNAPIITTDGSKKSRYEAANAYVLENLAPGGTVYISRAVADALGDRIRVTSLGTTVKLKGKSDFEVLVLDEIAS